MGGPCRDRCSGSDFGQPQRLGRSRWLSTVAAEYKSRGARSALRVKEKEEQGGMDGPERTPDRMKSEKERRWKSQEATESTDEERAASEVGSFC